MTGIDSPPPARRGRARPIAFLLVEGLASLGNAMAVFALEIWIYRSTGSYSLFASVALLGALPGVLLSPLTGPLLDRLPRGVVLLACSGTAIALGLACALALSRETFSAAVAASLILGLAVVQTARWPTLLATVSELAAPRDIERITAYEESVEAAISVAAPFLGVLVLSHAGIAAAVGIVAVTYSASVIGVFALRLPLFTDKAQLREALQGYAGNFRSDVAFGFRWIRARPHMLRLLVFVGVLNLGANIFVTMQSPYALTLFDAPRVGLVSSMGGVGLALGGLFVALAGGLRPPTRAIYLGTLGIVSGIAIYGTSASFAQCAGGVFLFTFFHPIVNTAMQVMWRQEAPVQKQGAIFSVRRMLTSALGPVGIAASIPLSRQVFGPAAQSAAAWLPVNRLWPHPATLSLGATLVAVSAAMAAMVLLFRRGRFLELRADDAIPLARLSSTDLPPKST